MMFISQTESQLGRPLFWTWLRRLAPSAYAAIELNAHRDNLFEHFAHSRLHYHPSESPDQPFVG